MSQGLLFEMPPDAGAQFDPLRIYRYALWREWGDLTGSPLLWIMLNPSTADEFDLDPTLRRCKDFTQRFGFSGMQIGNIYAYRSTDPDALWTIEDPVGPENLVYLDAMIASAGKVICGWGTKAKPDAVAKVVEIFRRRGVVPYCLRHTKDGHPEHPLYLRKTLEPVPWQGAT